MHSSLLRAGARLGLALAVLLAAGCADDSPPSAELVAEDDNVVQTMLRDGDAIYAAGTHRLERIDARTGEIQRVAGPEWAQCPQGERRWRSEVPLREPSLVLRGSKIFIHAPSCGLWSFDVSTGEKAMIAATSGFATKWSGQPGPNLDMIYPVILAADGDGLVACTAKRWNPSDPAEPLPTNESVELWSLSADGTPRERLISHVEGEYASTTYCKTVVVDAQSILFTTTHGMRRFDRATRVVTKMLEGSFKYGLAGVAQDAEDVFYTTGDSALFRMPRNGGPATLLLPPLGIDPFKGRHLPQLDGENLYFFGEGTLKRMPKSGGEVIDLGALAPRRVLQGTPLGFANEDVYFASSAIASEGEVVDPATGTSYTSYTSRGALFRWKR